MSELKARGTGDRLVAVGDGLKGFPEAITTVYQECIAQTRIVHLICYSLLRVLLEDPDIAIDTNHLLADSATQAVDPSSCAARSVGIK